MKKEQVMMKQGAFEPFVRAVQGFVPKTPKHVPAKGKGYGWSFFAPLGQVDVRPPGQQKNVIGRVTVSLVHVHVRTVGAGGRHLKTPTPALALAPALYKWLADYMDRVQMEWMKTMKTCSNGTHKGGNSRHFIQVDRPPVATGPGWATYITQAVLDHDASFLKVAR
jgi:hypothetical protein